MRSKYLVSVFALVAAVGLTSCVSNEVRFASVPTEPTMRLASRFQSVEVATVSLPVYATGQSIFVANAGGEIKALGPLWADDPDRAITLQLARDLALITDTKIAPEPWPFRGIPEAKIEVRIEEMLALSSGEFRVSGVYFVAPEARGTDRSRIFSISVPLPDATNARQIVEARSAAVTQLAEDISRRGLR